MTETQKLIRVATDLEQDKHEKLLASATTNHRSLAAELRVAIERYLESDEQSS